MALFFLDLLKNRYNGVMNNETYSPYSNCCGRPFGQTTPQCAYTCGKPEQCGCAVARFQEGADPCKACAVIPTITTESVDGLTNLANTLVHITSTNTTYYIDDKHRPMIIWAGPVEIDSYDIITNTLDLRSQTCYTTVGGVYSEVYFDKTGTGHIIGKEA